MSDQITRCLFDDDDIDDDEDDDESKVTKLIFL